MQDRSIECDTNLKELGDCSINDKKVIQSMLLYILIGLWIFLRVVDCSNYVIAFPNLSSKISFTSNLLRIIFLIYFLFYWVFSERSKIKFVCFILFLSFAILSYILSNTFFIYDLFFIPLFMINFLESKKLFMIFFIFVILAITTVVSLSYLSVLHSPITLYRDNVIRYSFGFMHPNTLGFVVTILSICFVIFNKKFILFDLAFLICASLYCFYYPKSFTSTYIIGLFAIFLLVVKIFKFNLNSRLIKNILFCAITFVFISIIFFVFYQTFTESFNTIIDRMPGAIKTRFEFNKIAYDRYGLSIFGTPMRIILAYQQVVLGLNEPYFTVDCAYFFTLIQYGVVNFVAYILLVIYCIKNSIKNENMLGALLCLILALYGISETVVLTPLCMIVYAYCFYNNYSNSKQHRNVIVLQQSDDK